MKKKFFLLFLVLIVVLSGCQSASPEPNTVSSASSTSEPIPTPSADKAIVTGRILSIDGKTPYDNLVIRLARVYRDGDQAAFALDMGTSPGDFTDPNGVFVIPDVSEAEYVAIIGDPEGIHVVMSDDDTNATVYQAEAGKTLDLGDLKVDLQP